MHQILLNQQNVPNSRRFQKLMQMKIEDRLKATHYTPVCTLPLQDSILETLGVISSTIKEPECLKKAALVMLKERSQRIEP